MKKKPCTLRPRPRALSEGATVLSKNCSSSNDAGPPGEPVRRSVRMANPQGLHMRPAAAFAQRAREFSAEVTVWYNNQGVNGKSWVDIMLLAVSPNAEVVIEARGTDADVAVETLARILGSPDPEGLSPPGISPKG